MKWKTVAQWALMLGIRYAPVPWWLKRRVIFGLTPKTLVVGTALIPDGDGRLLLLRTRYSGRWIPPGGGLHPGENPAEGVRRECREELGLEVQVERLVGLYVVDGVPELFVVFQCRPLADRPRLSPEHEAYRYVSRDGLPWWMKLFAEDAAQPAHGDVIIRTIARSRTAPRGADRQ